MAAVDEQIRAGNLDEAVRLALDDVRRAPAAAKPRILLFQLLAVNGQWQRALTHLNVVGDLVAGTHAMVQAYREALLCEAFRAEVFLGRRAPLILGNPVPWMGWLLEALRLSAAGGHERAAELRARAFDAAPATPGAVGEEPFEWIADIDMRLGPMLEAIVNGRYYWIPFSRIRRIQIDPPNDLRDVVWTPAYFTWANDGEAAALIPTRYAGSEADADPQIRLGRKTGWIERPGEQGEALGQRMFATDAGEYSIMDLRTVTLRPSEEPEAAASSPS